MKHAINRLTKTMPEISKILHHPAYFGQKSFSNIPKRVEHETRFADPTYDDTFKRLFGEESSKGLLINVLNNFLGFSGSKTIEEVEINNPALEARKVVGEMPSIKGAIDILCTTSSGQKIAVEMQGQKTKYFLAREQEYMAKLISGQVKEGEGALYHAKVLDTYIIVLAKKNLFVGETALKDSSLYEVDVVPMVRQTQEIYPGNKMHWKFFELEKFALHGDSQNITKESPLKLQWLDFLLNCAHQSDIPQDRDEVIKKGYHVMDKMSWDPDDRTMHWKNIRNEQEGEQLLADKEAEGIAKGEAKGEAKGIKVALKHNPDLDLEKDFQISPQAAHKIKNLPIPPKAEDIEKILIGEYKQHNLSESSVNISGDTDITDDDGGLS